MRKKYLIPSILIVALAALALIAPHHWSVADRPAPGPLVSPLSFKTDQQLANGENLLKNGDFDDPNYDFYWRPPNHYVAGMWFEWFLMPYLPEFIDGGIPYHNECYPQPEGVPCYGVTPPNRSQGYIRWGEPYMGGVYQLVEDVTPCTLYQFTVYNRNDRSNFNPRVGIDPTGANLPMRDPTDPDRYPFNCPPDGMSECPKPFIYSRYDLPQTIVWSEDCDHEAYTWAPCSVKAEAVNTTIGAWTYAYPDADANPSRSTYWDAGTLAQIPFPNDRLPAPESTIPSGFIFSINENQEGDQLEIGWLTTNPAISQIWYTIIPSSTVTGTTTLSETMYLPLVGRTSWEYPEATELNLTAATTHNGIITGIVDGDTVRYVIVARRSNGSSCQTEFVGAREVTISIP
ncbi:MAG: hypothetical protein JXB35_03340 [Anaerolineae bacterium]|nr:hypothetical protein [Anaerolineae bacterium]